MSTSLVILVVIVIILVIGRRSFGLLSLLVILLLLLGLLHLAKGLPLVQEGIGLSHVIGDDDVVKDGAALHLPEDEAEVSILVQLIVIDILRVGNLLCLPDTLVGWVGDLLHSPLAFVLRVVNHGGFPLTILLIIPIIRLLGSGIHDSLLR